MPDLDLSRLAPDERKWLAALDAGERITWDVAVRELLRRLASRMPSEEEVAAAERVVHAELRGCYASRVDGSICARAVLRAAGRE